MTTEEMLRFALNGYQTDIVPKLEAAIAARDREIEVLTTERDNALLRVEELEQIVDEDRGVL
jgi:hypothetical protein